jgi:hypothetical protein
MLSLAAGYDVGTEAAFHRWLQDGRPGYPLPGERRSDQEPVAER